jgi:soluble cytochrome b562
MIDNINSLHNSLAATNLFQKSPANTILEAMKASREEQNPLSQRSEHDQASTVYRHHVQNLTGQIKDLQTQRGEMEIAAEAVEDVRTSLERMEEIAQEVNEGVPDEDKLTDLTQEFQALAAGVDKAVENTAANDKALLNGGEQAVVNLRAAKGMALTDDAVGNIERALQDTDLAEETLSSGLDRVEQYLQDKTAALTKYEASEEKISSWEVASNAASQSSRQIQQNAVTAYMTQAGLNPASAYFLLQ